MKKYIPIISSNNSFPISPQFIPIYHGTFPVILNWNWEFIRLASDAVELNSHLIREILLWLWMICERQSVVPHTVSHIQITNEYFVANSMPDAVVIKVLAKVYIYFFFVFLMYFEPKKRKVCVRIVALAI